MKLLPQFIFSVRNGVACYQSVFFIKLTSLYRPIHSNGWDAELFREVVWEALWTEVILSPRSSLTKTQSLCQLYPAWFAPVVSQKRWTILWPELNWSFLYKLHWVSLGKSVGPALFGGIWIPYFCWFPWVKCLTALEGPSLILQFD